MNDFAQMINQPLCYTITISHDKVMMCAVGQFKVKDLQLWLEATHNIEQRLLDKDKSLLDTHIEQLQAMLFLCIDFTEYSTEIYQHIRDYIDDFWELVCAVVVVNDVYFKHIEKTRKKSVKTKNKENENDWFDSVQLLVSYGHSLESVFNMGFVQFLGFVTAVQKQMNQNMVAQVNLNRLAYHGQRKDIDCFFKKMELL